MDIYIYIYVYIVYVSFLAWSGCSKALNSFFFCCWIGSGNRKIWVYETVHGLALWPTRVRHY